MGDLPLSSRRRALRARFAIVRMLPSISRPMSAGLLAAVVAGAALPVAFLIATGVVVGAVPGAVREGWSSSDGRRLAVGLVAAAVVFVAQQIVGPIREWLAIRLGTRVDVRVRGIAMRAASGPRGIAHLEDADFLDKISLAQGFSALKIPPGGTVRGLAPILSAQLAVLGSVVIVCMFRWWLGLLLFAACATGRSVIRRRLLGLIEVLTGQTRTLRRSTYFRDAILGPSLAKEARVFGLGAWLVERYRFHWLDAMTTVWRSRHQAHSETVLSLLAIAGTMFLALATVGREAVGGAIGLERAVILVQAIAGTLELLSASDSDFMVEYGSATILPVLEAAREAEALAPTGPSLAADGLPRHDIRFQNVAFRYPGAHRDVYEGLDLHLPAGTSTAIVGANGAGKTTLVKLLTGLYEPQSGMILVDGVDVRDLDAAGWQRRVAAIFQDFVRYPASARDNVAYASGAAGDEALREAARRAGALEIVDALPHGWDTVLSREFEGGVDLSGGQWQRIALARALHAVGAGAGVLVLDEPTANLDVRAEADLYDRFLDLTQGLTTVLISHRFSTVRRADRICVLDGGRVVETGSHDELVAAGGLYERMFRIQASRFEEEAEPVEAS